MHERDGWDGRRDGEIDGWKEGEMYGGIEE